MKRIVLIALLIVSFRLSAEVFNNGEKISETFLSEKKYIKLCKDNDNVYYIPIDSVIYLCLDEDDFRIVTKHNSSGSDEIITCDIKRWNVTTDEKGNIIITKK